MKHVVWSQWKDLIVPDGFQKLSPESTPLDSSNLEDITFYVAPYLGGRRVLEYSKSMPNLQVLQVPNAGFEDALEFLRPGITLCNARGVHDASTAELAVALAISSRRGFFDFKVDAQNHDWNPKRFKSFNDSNIGIIGAGSIAKKLGKYIEPYDVTITYFSRTGADGAKKIVDIDDYLGDLDIIFLVIPLNQESRGMFNKRRLSLMKTGALLVNIGRGPIIETDALVAELNSGRLYAGLDVTDPEPLPKNHPLWTAKNLILTPHIGGNSSAFEPRAKKMVENQLVLLNENKPLENVVAQG